MDVDRMIIDGVRQLPCLYVSSANMAQRNEGWKQLSQKLKMKEQQLRIRWHLLVQRYQRDVAFKYAKHMNFVKRIPRVHSDNLKWPEFQIMEDDLLEQHPVTEVYEFLEVDDLDQKLNAESGECSKENNVQQNHNVTTDNVDSAPPITERCSDEQKPADKVILQLAASPIVLSCPNEEPIAVTDSKNQQNVGAAPTNGERGEDDIFGELVAAMLKRMDTEKKRAIKKQIMNQLLT